jgi:hypothetical protein
LAYAPGRVPSKSCVCLKMFRYETTPIEDPAPAGETPELPLKRRGDELQATTVTGRRIARRLRAKERSNLRTLGGGG